MKFQSGKINFKMIEIVENKEITHTIHPSVTSHTANTGREGLSHEYTGSALSRGMQTHRDPQGSCEADGGHAPTAVPREDHDVTWVEGALPIRQQ